MRWLYLASIWLHVLAAAAWIGGMVFLVAVALPVVRGRDFDDVRTELLHRIGLRLRYVGWVLLGLLVLTGIANLALRGVSWEAVATGRLWAGAWGSALLYKVVLVGVTLVVSAVHDFWVGPRAVALMRIESESVRYRRYVQSARWMGRAMLVLSLAILALAITLPRGGI